GVERMVGERVKGWMGEVVETVGMLGRVLGVGEEVLEWVGGKMEEVVGEGEGVGGVREVDVEEVGGGEGRGGSRGGRWGGCGGGCG
ncbi:hypothetical protein, partial [Dermacoccus nishinomiyaensis]|uniref:hypothetical protein n=1 Tax=Dermacoccus nishinomiyaensis TaxID=1274 RepID=UPI001C92D111